MEDFLNRFPVVDDEDIDLITVYLSLQGYLDNLRKQVFADLIIRNGGEFVGLEVSNKRGNLCCLFPDPQYPGHYRLSFHDQAGPVSHLVYSTAEQALKEAISLGYREHTPGQLDRLSEDPHWQYGLARVWPCCTIPKQDSSLSGADFAQLTCCRTGIPNPVILLIAFTHASASPTCAL